MEQYKFLEEHDYFLFKHEFNEHIIYVFRSKTEERDTGTLQMPKNTDSEWDYYYKGEEIPVWFKELMEQSQEKAINLFRIKRVIQGKVDAAE